MTTILYAFDPIKYFPVKLFSTAQFTRVFVKIYVNMSYNITAGSSVHQSEVDHEVDHLYIKVMYIICTLM